MRRSVASSPRRRVPMSPCHRPFHSFLIWSLVAIITFAFVSLIVAAPIAHAHGYGALALVVYRTFGYLCHQIPQRSFYIEEQPLAVCARCTGLYFGFAAGVIVYPFVCSVRRANPPTRVWLLVAAAPTVIDFALGFFGIWENTHLSRSLTGALLGAVGPFYIVPGAVELSRINLRHLFVPSSAVTHQALRASYLSHERTGPGNCGLSSSGNGGPNVNEFQGPAG